MSALYAESSAVLRWLLGAPDATAIQQVLAGAAQVISSSITAAEVRRTLQRLVATSALTPDARDSALVRFATAEARWIVYAVGDRILGRVGEPFAREPVRTLDAIHLATAAFHAHEVGPLAMLSCDARVLENARAIGLGLALGG